MVIDSPQSNLPIPDYQTLSLCLLALSPPLEGWWINSRAVTKSSMSKQRSHQPPKSAESEAGERKNQQKATWTNTNHLQATTRTAMCISDSQVKCATATLASGGKGLSPGQWEDVQQSQGCCQPSVSHAHSSTPCTRKFAQKIKHGRRKKSLGGKSNRKNKTAW